MRVALQHPQGRPSADFLHDAKRNARRNDGGRARVAQHIMATGTKSPSGVFLYDDFRANLIIYRYDPGFVTMRKSKTDTMHSENSEDALTWNVFRSLAQIDPAFWLPPLFPGGCRC